MKEKAEYRSSIRSRNMIREAFYQLLEEKEVGKITVSDIVKIADINRATFYAHYDNIYSLIEEIENEFINEMYSLLSKFQYETFIQNPRPLISEMINYLDNLPKAFVFIVDTGEAKTFINKLKQKFNDYMKHERTLPEEFRNSKDFEIKTSFFSGGLANILTEWITGKLACNKEEFITILCNLVTTDFKIK